ncbi:MAG: MATE family efflux transporter [Erysipelotrichales bacterium]|nr:MATE family efflux transporter [Erysipelotrichales bacterium]
MIVLFTNKSLRNMIVPLFFEQLLVMLVGIIDTFVVSYVGESAVSGVSLVNMFNIIFIYLFTALASGGAVIMSQYLGSKNKEKAVQSSSQLLLFSTMFSIVLMTFVIIFREGTLGLLFGKVEEDVMKACLTYLIISAYSYPFLAIYNTGSSMLRSIGKTSTTMYISIVSNVINTVGNFIGVFILHTGVAGVAVPSLIARAFSAIIITIICFNQKKEIYYDIKYLKSIDTSLIKKILRIAIPSGFESGVFQLVKVVLSSIVALFGTYQIAANGVAQSIWSLAALVGVVMGPVYITVIGKCMGAKDIKAAQIYYKKLMKLSFILSLGWNTIIFAVTPIIMHFFVLEPQTKELVIILVAIHNIANAIIFPFSGPLADGLRATGDVKFTMIVSISSTILGRLILSVVLGIYLNMGVIGIALAMVVDWLVRALLFVSRYKSQKWQEYQMI